MRYQAHLISKILLATLPERFYLFFSSPMKHIFSLIVVVFALLIAFGSSDNESSESTSLNMASAESAYQVRATNLYAEFEDNGVAAEQKYKGQIIEVSGKVETIDRDILDEIYVTLEGDEYFGSIQCFFSEAHINDATSLKSGSMVTIKGRCTGKMGNVLLKDCVLK